VLRTFWNSFHKVLPRNEEYLGLANYATLAQDDIFWRAVGNTFTWACISPLAEVGIGLLLALALYARSPGMRFFRIAWFTRCSCRTWWSASSGSGCTPTTGARSTRFFVS